MILTDRPLIIAHRGFSARYLENTLAAFQGALDAGADMIEMDLHLTRDRQLVVIHDATTGRGSREKVRVRRVTLSRLKQVSLKGDHTVPTLEEVLGLLANRIPLNLELKGKGTGAALALSLLKRRPIRDLLVSSYRAQELKAFRELYPSVPVARIYTRIFMKDLVRSATGGHFSIHVNQLHIGKDKVEKAHRLGLKVLVFTVDDPKEIVRLFSMRVDGIFTNNPETALQVARAHGFR
jgi:glycerophosphoryl diester phosphodiesterase